MPTVATRRKSAVERRTAILEAALRLAAQQGLNNVTTAAVSREAGIAAGTLFLYFETKEALINALYVELVQQRFAAHSSGMKEAGPDKFKSLWYTFARWYLDEPIVSNVIQQCEVSFALTPESLAYRDELDDTFRRTHFPESDQIFAVPLQRQVMYALLMGPIQVLGQLREKGEIAITDPLLDETYRRVRSALEQ